MSDQLETVTIRDGRIGPYPNGNDGRIWLQVEPDGAWISGTTISSEPDIVNGPTRPVRIVTTDPRPWDGGIRSKEMLPRYEDDDELTAARKTTRAIGARYARMHGLPPEYGEMVAALVVELHMQLLAGIRDGSVPDATP